MSNSRLRCVTVAGFTLWPKNTVRLPNPVSIFLRMCNFSRARWEKEIQLLVWSLIRPLNQGQNIKRVIFWLFSEKRESEKKKLLMWNALKPILAVEKLLNTAKRLPRTGKHFRTKCYYKGTSAFRWSRKVRFGQLITVFNRLLGPSTEASLVFWVQNF